MLLNLLILYPNIKIHKIINWIFKQTVKRNDYNLKNYKSDIK